MESDMVTEVPEALKRLTRYIVRGFYSVEHSIVGDLLVRNPCMKEDDLLELLKFERKQLRAILETLKQDQFLKVRMRVETDSEGKTTRHNYYFINYKVFVNVVKYKLDHMRRKIETEERDSTSRASFKCPSCDKQYTDLEADQLYDFTTQQFICTYCGAEVEEQMQTLPKKDAITLVAKFNEQIEPVYALLREIEDIKLAPCILEPEPTNIQNLLKPRERGQKEHGVWSGDLKRDIGFGATESTVSVEVGDAASKPREIVQKERPIWMVESTVKGAAADAVTSSDSRLVDTAKELRGLKKNDMDDIMRTLLVHENKSNAIPNIPRVSIAADRGSDDSDPRTPLVTSSKTDETLETDDEEECIPLITIGELKIRYDEVTEELVLKMDPYEREEYIKVGQEMYSNMYDD